MLYWEDLEVDRVTIFGDYDVTREEVLEFARKYDPQPFHLSDEEAAKTHFGRIAASGWHTAAMTMAVIVRSFEQNPQAGLGSPGVDDLRWLKPVYPGDRLTVRGLWPAISDSQPESGEQHSLWAKRAMAAHRNAVENLVIFAPAVLAVLTMNISTLATQWAAAAYFFARLVHFVVDNTWKASISLRMGVDDADSKIDHPAKTNIDKKSANRLVHGD